MKTARIIGVRPRVLKKAEGEASPTQVFILDSNRKPIHIDLKSEEDEMDFLLGRYPLLWSEPGEDKDVTRVLPHHKKWSKPQDEEPEVHASQKVFDKKAKKWKRVTEIPDTFEGIRPGDRIAMALGGSGAILARDICEDGLERNIEVWRIAPYLLKGMRDARKWEKDKDALLFAELLRDQPDLFHLMRPVDVTTGFLMATELNRQQTMRDRIAAGNRLFHESRRELLRAKREGKPIDTIEAAFTAAKKIDEAYLRLVKTEDGLNEQLEKLLESLPVWNEILGNVTGIGTSLGARILAGVGDIRAFIVQATEEERGKIKALTAKLNAKLKEGAYEEGKRAITREIAGKNDFDRIVAVREYWNDQSRRDRGDALTEALELVKQRGKIERKAMQKGEAKFIAICDVHVMPDGTFPRFRRGGTEGPKGRPTLRQAFFLATDQFNRRPDSPWGKELLKHKAALKERHPEPIELPPEKKKGKLTHMYTPGHLLRMAKWRTATRFARWLYRRWVALERRAMAT